ncbi:MAG TPA: hypothetical protein VFD71_07385 [Planctomycetota bacterium]|jgi:hypothetical protein|nr:hypothetical protein [Planctomycetota bacterium]
MTETQVAKGVFLIVFGLLGVGAMLQSRGYIYKGAPSQAVWRDLRLWAIALLLLYGLAYAAL